MKYLKAFEERRYMLTPGIINIVLDSYLETAIWVEEGGNDDFVDKSIYDFSDNAKQQAKEEIEWFLTNAGDDIFYNVSNSTIGHDLWLSRNHHGSGFFDREYDAGDESFLMDLSNILGDISLEINDDKIDFCCYEMKYKNFDMKKYLKDLKLKKTINKFNL